VHGIYAVGEKAGISIRYACIAVKQAAGHAIISAYRSERRHP